jgi:hypothetical protein
MMRASKLRSEPIRIIGSNTISGLGHGHGLSSSTSITILPIGPGVPPCQILPDSHKGIDGNSGIGPIPIPDAIPRRSLRVISQWKYSGNSLLLYFHFVAALFPLALVFARVEATRRKYISTLLPHQERNIVNGGKSYDGWKTLSIVFDSR